MGSIQAGLFEKGAKPTSIPILPGSGPDIRVYERHLHEKFCASALIDNTTVEKLKKELRAAFKKISAKKQDFTPLDKLQGALIALSGKKGETKSDLSRIATIYSAVKILYSAFAEREADSYLADNAKKEVATVLCAIYNKRSKVENFANSILDAKSNLRLYYGQAVLEGTPIDTTADQMSSRSFGKQEIEAVRSAEQILAKLCLLAFELGIKLQN